MIRCSRSQFRRNAGDRARRPALLRPFPGASEPSPAAERKYPLQLDDSECGVVEGALYLLLDRAQQTSNLTHVAHAQAVLRRLHDDTVLMSYYDPDAKTIFVRASDESP